VSATHRGGKRRKDDFYETPEWCTRAILKALDLRADHMTILEPSAGHGAIVRVLREHPWTSLSAPMIVTVEIREDARLHLAEAGADVWITGHDFLSWETANRYDLLIGNPPFSLAFEFCQKCVGMADTVALLLRLNFLASKKRSAWMQEHTPSIYVLSKRPSFTGNGTDSADYAWFVWDRGPARVRILPETGEMF